jgi:shikimate kinase
VEKKHEIQKKQTSNLVLVGASIGAVQVIGQDLARLFGYGCLNLEAWLEVTYKKNLSELLKEAGAGGPTDKIKQAIAAVQKIHNHVVVLSQHLWVGEDIAALVASIGPLILLDFPVDLEPESRKKGESNESVVFFSDLPSYLSEKEAKKKQFSEILTLSESICQNADFIVNDRYSTSEEVARGLKLLLVKKLFLKFQKRK